MRWALNLLHGAALADRVYGPDLTMRVLDRCAAEGLPVYLYGSTDADPRPARRVRCTRHCPA